MACLAERHLAERNQPFDLDRGFERALPVEAPVITELSRQLSRGNLADP